MVTIPARLPEGLAALLGVAIIGIGARFLIAPAAGAAGFGVAAPAAGPAGAYLAVKGVRDIASGLVVLALLATGPRRAVGAALLALTVVPLGDAAIVLRHGGSRATAYGVHGATAAVLVAVGLLLLGRGR
jgi:hypothetical protein